MESMDMDIVTDLVFRVCRTYEGLSGLKLVHRIAGMHSSPKLNNAELSENKISLGVDRIVFEVPLTWTDKNDIRRSFSCMFGDGILKHNYGVSIFEGVNDEQMGYFKRFALEIWDTNIHRGFMAEQGYLHHDETKDLLFCHLNALKKIWEAVERHHLQSQQGLKRNSAHHTTITAERFYEICENNDKSMFDALEETIADQSTAAFRWYNLAKERVNEQRGIIERTPEQIQEVHRKKGLFYRFAKRKGALFFREEDASSKFQGNIWDCWVEYCNRFLGYWTNTFGMHYEHWNPPVDLTELNSLF